MEGGGRGYRWLLLALALPLGAWLLLQPRGVAVQVVDKTWRREIEIERQVMELHSEPCADMPADAQRVERRDVNGVAHCRFQAPVWRKRRWVVAETGAQPHWPAVLLTEGEREGRRHAWQALQLQDEAGRHWDCRLPLAAWQTWVPGQRTRLGVHRFSGVADCASLPPAPP